jgi:2-keto-4-pentenoate hydratase/2-oxohepta-3-ene-1,7-dioic acid hydratase in catechol pathway
VIFLRFAWEGTPRWGILRGQDVFAVDGDPFGPTAGSGSWLARLDQIELLPPAQPGEFIVAIRRNYAKHIAEAAMKGIRLAPPPERPAYLLKPSSTLVGSGGSIRYPAGETRHVDHEAELAIVIGRHGHCIAEAAALDYVFGYTCANDLTARDIPYADDQLVRRGKSFPTFTALGPWVVTGIDASDLGLACRVNGELRQSCRTGDMLFSLARIIAEVSQSRVLEPGDVILTGTPEGFASVVPGDLVEIEIEKIGVLRNPVVAV